MNVSDILARVLADNAAPARREVATILHQVARQGGWTLGPTDQSHFRSFDFTPLRRGSETIALLALHDAPALAVAWGAPEYMRVTFVDNGDVATAAEQAGLLYLPASELGRDLTGDNRAFIAALGPRWAEDLNCWNPSTVGEVLFNWWD